MKLRTRIIIAVLTASIIINLSLGLFITNQIRENELDQLHERIDQSVHMMKLVNAIPVYNVDKETLQMNMETFFDDRSMKSISFAEYDINIKLERPLSYPKGRDIVKDFFITHKGLQLGTMKVIYSTGQIEQTIDRLRNRILIVGSLGIALLYIILALLVNRLMRPVSELTKAASEIASGNLDREIDRNATGDIGDLSRNFSVMQDAIKEKINDLARININLENEILQKEINEKKIIKQNQVISSVNRFIHKAMLAQTYDETAGIFIPVILDVIPSRYAFICEIDGDDETKAALIATSENIQSDTGISEMDFAVISQEQEICGIREKIVKRDDVIIENKPNSQFDFLNFPENKLEIETFIGAPMRIGSEVKGIIMLAGKENGYDQDDKNTLEIMGTALMESLHLKKEEMKKKELEEMMIHSEKMVSIGGLAAGMAHEINNPLAGVLQNTQVVVSRLKEKLPPNISAAEELGLEFEKITAYMEARSIYRLLDLVLDAGKRAAEIVSNMLSFSRKSTSGYLLEDMCTLMDQTLKLAESDYNLKKKFDFKQITIIKNYDENLPPIRCKASEIQQVFFNLLSNGAQAMFSMPADHKPCFRLNISCEEENIKVEICDNGPGMEEKVRKRVFEPFFTTKTVGEGTGLGLSVSYFIITENHKGMIEAVSPPEGGTSFIIKLPVEGSSSI